MSQENGDSFDDDGDDGFDDEENSSYDEPAPDEGGADDFEDDGFGEEGGYTDEEGYSSGERADGARAGAWQTVDVKRRSFGGGIADAIIGSIVLFLIGLVALPTAFVIGYYSERVHDYSKDLEKALYVGSSKELPAEGLVKTSGKVTAAEFLTYKDKRLSKKKKLIHIQVLYEVLKEETEERTVNRDGRQVTERRKVRKWDVMSDRTHSKTVDSFMVGDIEVQPTEGMRWYGMKTLSPLYKRVKKDAKKDQLGDKRKTVSYLDATGEIFVAGAARGGAIGDGALFLVSKGSEASVLSSLKAEKTIITWVLRVLIFFCFLFGFFGILNPIVQIFDKADDYVPFLSIITSSLWAVIFTLSFLLTVVVIILSKFFWFIVLGLVAFLGYTFYTASVAKSRKDSYLAGRAEARQGLGRK